MRTLLMVCLISLNLLPSIVRAEEKDRQALFMSILRDRRLDGNFSDVDYMRHQMVKNFDGRIADLLPVALADAGVRREAILAIAGSLDPEAFPILLDLFMAPQEPLRYMASEAMHCYFRNLPQPVFFDEKMAERLGQHCQHALVDPESEPDYRKVCLGWIGKLKYAPAESSVLEYARNAIRERGWLSVHVAVVALSQMGSPHVEELVLSEDTRKAMRGDGEDDHAWFGMLRETMATSERIKKVVKEIVLSGDMGGAKGYRIYLSMVVMAALDIGDKECLDMIWDMMNAGGDLPQWIVQRLMHYPRAYVRSPEEERLLLETVKKSDVMLKSLRSIRRTPSDRIKEGSIYHWLASPDSPLDLTEPEPTSQKSPLKVPPNKK